ncbi:MAG: alpha/beta hydrolase [Lachnospiraceae bacterium]|nr:alpha/beta hydrolase [Lachnospiraceae bacterium]
MQITIEKVHTETFSMPFFRFGHGNRTLVMLPGLSVQSVMGAASAVESAYKILEDDFTVYLFEYREELPYPYSIRDMAKDAATAMQTLGLSDVCLFGVSLGGMVAMEVALLYPELVKTMVLGSTSANVEGRYSVLEHWIRLAKQNDATGLYLDFGEKVYPPAVFKQCRDMLVSAAETVTEEELAHFVVLAEGAHGFNVLDELDGIHCPVLTIGDKTDAVLGKEASEKIAEKLKDKPGCSLYMYDGYGHAAYDTAPDYKERIREFFCKY